MKRFWAKVDKTDGCWLWTAAVAGNGYGKFSRGKRGEGEWYAHVFSWELVNDPVPEGLQLDHLCWVKRCVNPAHLRVLTPKQHGEHRRGPNRNSTSGIRGVYFNKDRNKWRTQIGHNGRTIHGGYFDTAEEANEARIALEQKYFTHSDWHDGVREPNTTPRKEGRTNARN